MLANLIGTFDFPSALVVLGIVAAFGMPAVIAATKRVSKAELDAKRMQLEFEDVRDLRAVESRDRQELARIASEREQRMLSIEKGTITSHSRSNGEG